MNDIDRILINQMIILQCLYRLLPDDAVSFKGQPLKELVLALHDSTAQYTIPHLDPPLKQNLQ